MHGFPSTRKKTARWPDLLIAHRTRMFMVCASVGMLSALVAAHVRLHLGLPGHKALIWMTPIVFARLLTRSKPGATAGVSAAAITSLGLGAPLAGGPWGLPLIALAGAVLDTAIWRIEKHSLPLVITVPLIGLTAMFANLLCLAKRMANPVGAFSHDAVAAWWFRPVSYAAFGLMAGLMAATAAAVARRKQHRG
jgi:hypothetical protein